tara:strand:+ start:326 stop:694 length:369 start_codon:yes stop_codon:yes gene_type:complete
MENLTIVRRTKNIGSSIGHGLPVFRVDIAGRFIFTKTATELLELKKDDGIMFGFNYKEQTAYLFKEDETDSFRIRQRKDSSRHFTSKPLMVHFIDCFKLNLENKQHFLLTTVEKGFKITIKK